jgi:hypothetical protein
MTEAIKFDNEKPGMDLLPVGAKKAIAEVFDFGAKKYARHNWRNGFNYSRLIAAAERHLDAFNDGEDLDPESGKPHLAHLGCCVLMLLESTIKGYGTDDRYKPEKASTLANPDSLHFPSNEFGKVTAQATPTYVGVEWKPAENSSSDHNVISAQMGGLNECAKKVESWLERKAKEAIK